MPKSVITRPAVSYYEALRAGFKLNDVLYEVMTCACTDFIAFLRQCCQGKSTHAIEEAFMLLIDDSDLARWQALDMLIQNKIIVPLERG